MGVGLPNFLGAFFGPKTRFLPWYNIFFVNSPALICSLFLTVYILHCVRSTDHHLNVTVTFIDIGTLRNANTVAQLLRGIEICIDYNILNVRESWKDTTMTKCLKTRWQAVLDGS